METLSKSPKKTTNNTDYLSKAVIETFHGNTYSCFDYSNDEDYIYIHYVDGDFRIEESSLKLTESEIDRIYEMLMVFIEENKES